jgi:hypothetical protein
MRSEMQGVRRTELALLLCKDQPCTVQYGQRRPMYLKKFAAAREQMAHLPLAPENRAKVDSALSDFDSYVAQSEEIIQEFLAQEKKDVVSVPLEDDPCVLAHPLVSCSRLVVSTHLAVFERGHPPFYRTR